MVVVGAEFYNAALPLARLPQIGPLSGRSVHFILHWFSARRTATGRAALLPRPAKVARGKWNRNGPMVSHVAAPLSLAFRKRRHWWRRNGVAAGYPPAWRRRIGLSAPGG